MIRVRGIIVIITVRPQGRDGLPAALHTQHRHDGVLQRGAGTAHELGMGFGEADKAFEETDSCEGDAAAVGAALELCVMCAIDVCVCIGIRIRTRIYVEKM